MKKLRKFFFEQKLKKINFKKLNYKIIGIFLLNFFLLLTGIVIFFLLQPKKENAKILVSKVGKLIELPLEEPTIATVTDKTKLQNQPFFAKAENGDKLLLYPQNRKAILYRPKINKIIEVSSLNLETSPTPLPQTFKVVLYNGTKTVGLTKKAEKLIKEKLTGFEVVDRDNAFDNTYSKNLIINLKNVPQAALEKIKEIIEAEIISFPEKEKKPIQGDILIILGENFAKNK